MSKQKIRQVLRAKYVDETLNRTKEVLFNEVPNNKALREFLTLNDSEKGMSQAHFQDFVFMLLDSSFMIPVAVTFSKEPTEDKLVSLDDLAEINALSLGTLQHPEAGRYYSLYIDEEALSVLPEKLENILTLNLPFTDFLDMIAHDLENEEPILDGLLINPFTSNIILDRELLKALIQRYEEVYEEMIQKDKNTNSIS